MRLIYRTLVTLTVLLGSGTFAYSADGTTRAGDVISVGLPVAAAGMAWYQNDTAGLWQLAKSEATTILLTEVLKQSVRETRPNGEDNRSFPSRHASVAFSAAQFMQIRDGWQYGVPAYLAASFAGYSRVRADEHYWRDVVGGGLLGVVTSSYFTKKRKGTNVGLAFGLNSASIQIQQDL